MTFCLYCNKVVEWEVLYTYTLPSGEVVKQCKCKECGHQRADIR